jgi:hypothetical protein
VASTQEFGDGDQPDRQQESEPMTSRRPHEEIGTVAEDVEVDVPRTISPAPANVPEQPPS